MKKGKMMLAAVAGSMLLSGAAMAGPAEQKGTNQAKTQAAPTATADAVSQRVLAYQVADWGKKNGNPSALILAARMLNDAPASAEGVDGTAKPLPGAPAAGTAPATLKPAVTTQSLLTDAKALANGDRYLLQQASLVEGSATKSPVAGTYDFIRDVPARSVYTFTFNARGGELLRVGAAGDGDTDVDLVLRDGNGNIVCTDRDTDSWGVCSVTPAWTGQFRLEVINNGSVWTRTRIIAN